MIELPRRLLVGFAIAFSLYFPLAGFLNIDSFANRGWGLAAAILYVAAVIPSICAYPGLTLPRAQAIFNLIAASLVPLFVNQRLSPADAQSFGAWYVGGVGMLLAVTAVREHPLVAWLGMLSLTSQIIIWGSPTIVLQIGLVGSLLFVAAGQGIARGLRLASTELKEYPKQARLSAAASASATASRLERKRLVEGALQDAVPTLKYLVSRQGHLTQDDKKEALMLEAQLRDEIRGRSLIDRRTRAAAKAARLRGVTVAMLDDGGLSDASQVEIVSLRGQIVEALNSVAAGQVTVRAVSGEPWRVTILATRSGVTAPDLWLRL